MILAIDGPTASGKGTLARRLAAHYGLPCLDTGLLYRGVAHLMLEAGLDPDDHEGASELARTLDMDRLDASELRSARVGAMASIAAAIGPVRAALKQLQRDFADQPGGAVLDGRDIGTVICPDADVKLWVDADVEERARRRWEELKARGEDIGFDSVLDQVRERDARDAGRKDAPMRRAEDAHLLDTSQMSIDAAFEEARRIVDQALAGQAD